MRHERRNPGPEHASGEWATGHGTVVLVSRETQEEPDTGNRPIFTDPVDR